MNVKQRVIINIQRAINSIFIETTYLYPDPDLLVYENGDGVCITKVPFASFHPDAEGFKDSFSDHNLGVADSHKEEKSE